MSLIRFLLIFILFYIVYRVIKLFIANFRIGAGNNNIHGNGKPKSKYENIEEAKFTEIKENEENHKK